ncbi:MAG: hypothetical protein ACR2NH_07360 [Solirubrobacteraceae bacterium]
MEEAFGIVIFAVVIGASIVAVITFLGVGKVYDQIGRGGLSLNEDDDGRPRERGGGSWPVNTAERDAEIRQMLAAKNARRVRRGEAPLDVESELQRLTAPSVDAALREEIRQLVVARNARRERRGEAPLDVDAEVERQVRELG